MDTQHTPGPWRYTSRIDGSGGHISAVGGGCIPIRTPFRIDAFDDGPNRSAHTDTELEANARLIAVSPDMLDMLKLIDARLDVERKDAIGETSYVCAAWHDDIKALIAKAAGGEHGN